MSGVLYVTTTFPTIAWFLESEVDRLDRRGVRVNVITLRPIGTRYQPEHRRLLALTRAVGSPFDPRGMVALLGWLMRRPHVLVPAVVRVLWASRGSGYAFAGHLGYLPAAARVADLAVREDFDRIHGAWAHFPATVAWLAARLAGRRFSMAAHAGADLYRTQAFLGDKVRDADFVCACVRGNAEMLRRLGGPESRVHWIYHGVDRAAFDGQGRVRADAPMLLAVGRLATAKGFDLAVEALGVLAVRGLRPRLVIVGEGPEGAALQGRAQRLGVAEQIEWTGQLTRDQLLPHYRAAWALLAPSRVQANGRRDGIPNVVVEALAMGVPCIGSRAAGLEEAIDDGVNGLLVPADDAAALADAIERAMRDPASLDRMGEAARRRVGESFDAAHNFERTYALMTAGAPVPAPAAVP